MKDKILPLLTCLYAATATCLQATTVDTDDWKFNDFASGYLEPFAEDQGFTGSAVLDEGFRFVTASGNRYCLIEWKESEYDGTRRERGHEIKGQVTSDYVVYSGWEWYFPKSNNNFISADKDTIIWQMYCWNSAGCSNWTAHMVLKKDDLYFGYRAACVTETETLVKSNLVKNRWYGVACALRPGNGTGLFDIKIDGSSALSLRNINVGFGDKNSDGSMQDAVIGVKMGIYASDTAGYSNNEQRRIRIDNLAVADRDNGASSSTSWNRVQPW